MSRLRTAEITFKNHTAVNEYYQKPRAITPAVMLANYIFSRRYNPSISYSDGAIDEISAIASVCPVIFTPNHLREEDQYHVASAIRKTDIPNKITHHLTVLGKIEYKQSIFNRWLSDTLGVIPAIRLKDIEDIELENKRRHFVQSSEEMIQTSVAHLALGRSIEGFPESQRNTSERFNENGETAENWKTVQNIGTGMARIACLANVAVVPIGIAYNPDNQAHVHFGNPIMPPYENPQALKRDMQTAIQYCTDLAFENID